MFTIGAMARLKPVIAICAVVFSGVAHAWHGEPPNDPLVRVHYDYEVVQYCSLANDKVITGFRRQLASIVAETGASRDAIEAARSIAWKAAHLEWQNRGLGGFRGWCKNEGRQAATRFGDA
jgi:hypothetical protein